MTDQQQRTSMEWVMTAAVTVSVMLAGWSLYETQDHANRITALETQQIADEKFRNEKFEQMIGLLNRTNADIAELKEEVRRLRNRP